MQNLSETSDGALAFVAQRLSEDFISALPIPQLALCTRMDEKPGAVEYVVEGRDEQGQPSVIGRYIPRPPSQLLIQDNKKLSRKRRKEREALKAKNQASLHQLFYLPLQHEALKEKRRSDEEELQRARERATKAEEDKGTDTNEKKESSYTVVPLETGTSSMVFVYFALCVLFLAMSLFPEFRSWVAEKALKAFGEQILPHLLQAIIPLTTTVQDKFPLTSNIILTLYRTFGGWVLVLAGCKILWIIFDFAKELYLNLY